ncbi:helix-turn-helix domain-containing protein [Saccharomonospora xinjiangensis]|uniref:helix-turn-helix domain-containing protein n=1 Tax=Saccharomonospora xinjiangensis TaxID=75294 RepID=UPI00350F858A
MTSEFGAQLRLRRRAAGLTQEQLSERSGVGVRTIRGFETGERAAPRMATVRLLAEALELSGEERDALVAAALGTAPGARTPSRPSHGVAGGGDSGTAPAGETAPQPAGDGGATGSVPVPTAEAEAERPGGDAGSARNGGGGDDDPKTDRADGTGAAHLDDALADAAAELAMEVGSRWRREEENRQIHDPFPLPVRWHSAREDVADHDENVYRVLPDSTSPAPGVAELRGSLADVVDTYRSLPSGRMVVLGRAGSGKTVLTLRFLLDLLKIRRRADPVPVIVGLGSWDPGAASLRDWLTDQLERDHPEFAATSYGSTTLAAALVEAGLVLPVLDGFDEIADGLRRPALRALNATTLPLLLTSRPDEYVAAVEDVDVLTSAAVVELCDLTVSDLAAYLPRTARKRRFGGKAATVWDPVLAELTDHPERPGCANLALVLATPLMVGLARAVYSDQPGRDPAELLDTERFGTPEAIETHLFDTFVPTAYQDRPGGEQSRWDVRRVPYWLGYLAKHLDRLGSRDLAWWQLGNTLGASIRMLVVGVLAGAGVGLAEWLVMGLVSGVLLGPEAAKEYLFGLGLVDTAHVTLAAGLAFALAHGLAFVSGTAALEPSRSRIGVRRGRTNRFRVFVSRFRVGLLAGALFGVLIGIVWGIIRWLVSSKAEALLGGLIDAFLCSVVFGLGAGVSYGVIGMLETSRDIRSISSPADLLRLNRRTVLAQLCLFGPMFGLVVAFGGALVVAVFQGILGPLSYGVLGGFLWGSIGMVGGGLGYVLCMTAWGQWVVFARIYLPLTGRLPWKVPAFLDDAYRRGVLRQAGTVYQFRHARLHDHLSRVFDERDNA